MNVLIIRHGEAEDQEIFARSGEPDQKRPLTEEGRKAVRRTARALAEMVERIDLLASSPFVRAMETARIVSRQYQDLDIQEVQCLAPGQDPVRIIDWLNSQPAAMRSIALVGHEPILSQLVGLAIAERNFSPVKLGKAGACLLEFAGEVRPGRAVLHWLLTAAQLELIARGVR
ncbi:phosphohistidine phosphatase SixA [Fontivita pretiosa]|uniref:phosphohistidine phosphatase SixA n=1 Tax=Fontivita pretiosa TaxID=2989684 RepID=UPI003D1824E1